MILGGRDKGSDFSLLAPLLQKKAEGVVLVGEAADKIAADLGNTVQCQRAWSVADAVRTAREMARPGEVVLFSPACASFDMFRNFEERGDTFKDEVAKIS